MKYGKQIVDYRNSIKKNRYINNEKIYLNYNSIIQYKLLKKIIKNLSINVNNNNYLHDECCICMEVLGYDYITLRCNHSYHIPCAINLFNYSNNCSLCRKTIIESYPIFQFFSILKSNIDSIEAFHNKMNNIINYKKSRSNFLWIRWNCSVNILSRLLKQFDSINFTGIRKILKKFTKKTNYNTDFILNYCKNLNFFKSISS